MFCKNRRFVYRFGLKTDLKWNQFTCFSKKPIFEPVIEEAPGPLRHCFHCYCGEFCSGRGRQGGIRWTSAAAERPGRPAWPIGSPFVERVTGRATRIEAVGTAHAEYRRHEVLVAGTFGRDGGRLGRQRRQPHFSRGRVGGRCVDIVSGCRRPSRRSWRPARASVTQGPLQLSRDYRFFVTLQGSIFVFPGPILNRPLTRLVSWTGTFIVLDKLPGKILREMFFAVEQYK